MTPVGGRLCRHRRPGGSVIPLAGKIIIIPAKGARKILEAASLVL